MSSRPPQQPERRSGSLDEALANGRQMLRDHPDMALAQAQAILKRDGANGDALRLAASAHRVLGQAKMAEQAEFAAIAASEREPGLIAAARALNSRDYGEASRLAAEYLRDTPGDLAALTLSAESAIALGVPDKAQPILGEVLRRAPSFMPARLLQANALMLLDRLTESRAMVFELLDQEPDHAPHYAMLWRLESDLGNHMEAATACEHLIRIKGDNAEDWVNYGDNLRFGGRKSDALLAYRRAISVDSNFGRAWWSLADIDAQGITDDDIETMENALGQRGDDPETAGHLHFALGIAYDARKQNEQAFAHFAKGNALRGKAQPYAANEISEQVDRYLAALPASAIPVREDANEGPVPIFIVGMPRSGSTLVERILGQHSQIEALGELSVAPHMMQRLKLGQEPEKLEQRIASMSGDELEKLGAWYLDRAAEHRDTGKPFFTDKLHMNWRHLPLILRMLPQARIVDVRRGAMDCCWSNYKTLFARGHPAASDLADIGQFFRDYVRLTDALRERAPGRIHLLSYEALVDDIRVETQKLFDAIGLEAEEQCLDFHLSQAPVATASSEQVRRPLNREGLDAWKPYEPWLGPLKDALGEHA